MSLAAIQAQAEMTDDQRRILSTPMAEFCPARTGAWLPRDGFNLLLVHRWIRTPAGMVCRDCRDGL